MGSLLPRHIGEGLVFTNIIYFDFFLILVVLVVEHCDFFFILVSTQTDRSCVLFSLVTRCAGGGLVFTFIIYFDFFFILVLSAVRVPGPWWISWTLGRCVVMVYDDCSSFVAMFTALDSASDLIQHSN